jgi:hypothetical protein
MTKNFREIEQAVLADPKRRENVEQEKERLLRAIGPARQIKPGAADGSPTS